MSIVFSDHALRQIKIRRIRKSQVIETITNYDEILPSFKNRKLRRKAFESTILEVVTITEGSKIIVVTAYFELENYEN